MMFLLSILCLLVSAEQRLLQTTGGWTAPHAPSVDELSIWDQTVESTSQYLMDDGTTVSLSSFGTPTLVSTQVVAGVNYKFEFSNLAEVTVFYQSWTNTLQVSKVEQSESSVPREVETNTQEDDSPREVENDVMTGAVSDTTEPTQEDLDAWDKTVDSEELDGEYGQEYLLDLGAPIAVSTQVVSGINYEFTFADGTVVEVYVQSWTNTYQVTDVIEPVVEEEVFIAGGMSSGHVPTDEEIELWYDAVEKAVTTGLYGESYLLSLNDPVTVQTQVVSGINYLFTFSDGTKVKVYTQSWTGTLMITDVDTTNTSTTRGRLLQEENLAGGVTQSDNCVDCDKWQEVLACGSPCMSLDGYEAFDYAALGKPISSATQVVAGINYYFEFADQTRITVLEQLWMTPSLKITSIDVADEQRDEEIVDDSRPQVPKQDANECPENQIWLNCQSVCPFTCGQPEMECMSLVCIEGCGCENGKYLDGEKCVEKLLCGKPTKRTKFPGANAKVLHNVNNKLKFEKVPR